MGLVEERTGLSGEQINALVKDFVETQIGKFGALQRAGILEPELNDTFQTQTGIILLSGAILSLSNIAYTKEDGVCPGGGVLARSLGRIGTASAAEKIFEAVPTLVMENTLMRRSYTYGIDLTASRCMGQCAVDLTGLGANSISSFRQISGA